MDYNFVIKCIKLNPEVYKYIADELKSNNEVLNALAGAPLYYNNNTTGDYGAYANEPLYLIILEYIDECNEE